MLSTIAEKLFDTGEVIISYAEGAPNGPPAVFLHGIQGKWQGVGALVSMLEDRWQVNALDLRGHGRSSHTPGQYHLLDYARDVGAFLAHLPEPAVVIGHSLGASIALATAAEYPSRTRAAVLVDPPIYDGQLAKIGDYPKIAEYLRWVYDTIGESQTPEVILARLHERNPGADVAGLADYADQLSRVDPDVLGTLFEDRQRAGFDLAGALERVRCPLLLLYGDWGQDAALPAVMRDEDAAFVRAHVLSATIVKVPGGSHMFFAEQPDLVKQRLDAFLSSV